MINSIQGLARAEARLHELTALKAQLAAHIQDPASYEVAISGYELEREQLRAEISDFSRICGLLHPGWGIGADPPP